MVNGEIGRTDSFGLSGAKMVKMDKMVTKEIKEIKGNLVHLVLMRLLM
jgi:hypothetical protein